MTAHGPEDELRACLQTLKAIDADRGLLTRLTQDERRELLALAGRITTPARGELRKMARAFRRGRTPAGAGRGSRCPRAGGAARAATQRYLRTVMVATTRCDSRGARRRRAARAERGPATAMSASSPYTNVHRYYDSMCRSCGDFNYAKREQSADLHGRVALVTGARVKIGFQAALKLLRAGAQVVALTRFPVDRGGALRTGSRLRALVQPPAGAWPRPAPHAQRGAVCALAR